MMGKRKVRFAFFIVNVLLPLVAFSSLSDSLSKQAMFELNNGRVKEALHLAKIALDSATRIEDRQRIATCNYRFANALQANGEFEKASKHFELAISVASETQDSATLCNALTNYGVMLLNMGLGWEAEKKMSSAIQIAEVINDSLSLAICYAQFGSCKYFQDDYEASFNSFQSSLKLAQALDIPLLVATCYQNLGQTAKFLNKYDQAEEFTKKGIELGIELMDEYHVNECYRNLSYIYLDQGMLFEALKAQRQFFSTLDSNDISLRADILGAEADIMDMLIQAMQKTDDEVTKLRSSINQVALVSLLIVLVLLILVSRQFQKLRSIKREVYATIPLGEHLKPLLEKGDSTLLFIYLYRLTGTKVVNIAEMLNKHPSRVSHNIKEIQSILGVEDISDPAHLQRFNMVDITQMIRDLDWKKVTTESL